MSRINWISDMQYNVQENILHRFLLMWLQMNQQRLNFVMANGSDEGWIPDLNMLFCPKCGKNDWDIIDTDIQTNDDMKMRYGVFRCRNKSCRFLHPPNTKISNIQIE